ncbi:MAG: FecCD family ABC transporter permease [Brevinema sp.]
MKNPILILLMCLVVLVTMSIVNVLFGHQFYSFQTLVDSFTQYNAQDPEHYILQNIRIPRAVIAILVGACLGMSGLLIQAITQNPMASPCIFGINAGAGFFVVLGILIFKDLSLVGVMIFSFIGASIAGFIVLILANMVNYSPVKIALVGIVLTALITSLTSIIIINNGGDPQEVLRWTTGSLTDRPAVDLRFMLGVTVLFVLVSFMAFQLNLFALGNDTAKALGQNIFLWRFVFSMFVILFAGFSVAIAGAIGFIGLIIPHVSRKLFGQEYKLLIPASILLGANFLLLADLLTRLIVPRTSLPIGLTMSVIGAPFLLYLAKQRKIA